MKRLVLAALVLGACAKKGGDDCKLRQYAADQTIVLAKKELAAQRAKSAAGSGSATGSASAEDAALDAREKLLDTWHQVITGTSAEHVAPDAGGGDASSAFVAARSSVIDYLACRAN